MENNKYQRGKIYKIVDNTNDNIYIGSTCEPTLARRLANHVGDYKRYVSGNRHFLTSFCILENCNYDIVLIELFPCNNKDELHQRERHYIESLNCVNKNIPKRSSGEYKKDNKEKINMQRKTYRLENKEKIKNYRNNNKEKIHEHFKCICGGKYTYGHKAEHMRSKKHLQGIKKYITLLDNNHDTLMKNIDEILEKVKKIKPLSY